MLRFYRKCIQYFRLTIPVIIIPKPQLKFLKTAQEKTKVLYGASTCRYFKRV